MKNQYFIPLNSSDCLTPSSVGYKAARLAEMFRHHYPVPEGCVITSHAFRDFCVHNNIRLDAITNVSFAGLHQAIINGDFPAHLQAQLEQAIQAFPFSQFAVRSSSVCEDSLEYSMAGQFDTFLSTPKDSVEEMIKRCWASMFSEAVISYAEKNNMPIAYEMGVIVQRQVQSLFSGVIFTMEPMTKSTDHLIVEWVSGLGDKLVSGQIVPERLYLNRLAPVIPKTSNLPEPLNQGLAQLVTDALEIEKLFNHPIDIEWAIDAAGLVILQARPITGLSNQDIVLWTNVNMVENFPQVLTPFTWSIVDRFYIYYVKNLFRLFGWRDKNIREIRSIVDNFTGIHGGRIYYNLSNWYEAVYFWPIGKWLKKLLDNFIGQNVPFSFEPASANRWASQGWRRPFKYLFFWGRLFKIYLTADFHLNKYEKVFFEKRNVWRAVPYNQLTAVQLLAILDDLFSNFVDPYYYNPGIVDILAAIFPGSLKLLSNRWLTDYADNTDLLAAQILQGVEIKSTGPAEIIETMARKIQCSKKMQALLIQRQYSELENILDQELRVLFEKFMHHFGGRCYKDCMIVSPTFEERHDLFWELVEKYQRADTNTAQKIDKSGSKKKTTRQKVLQNLSLFRRFIFRLIIKNAHRAIRLREQSRLIRSLLFGEIRQIALALGNQLAAIGHLEDEQDIFYLHHFEIEALVYGKFQFPETLPALIKQRKAALVENEKREPPSFFIRKTGHYFESTSIPETKASHDGSVLKGVGVSGGSSQGCGRIILDPVRDNRLEPGEILITKTTDPGWTPLFKIAGGLILERGGLLSHGAIVAREFGIPAIVGIEGATEKIEDGQMLRMNGDTGEIIIL